MKSEKLLMGLLFAANTGFTTAFSVPTLQAPRSSIAERRRRSMAMAAVSQEDKVEQEMLSDVDSRVLRSMLQDSKVNLDTEQDIQKLLERGTVKKVQPKSNSDKDSRNNDEYASTVVNKIADTQLWRQLSKRAENIWQSVGIWVTNKVENDVQTLAALGIFAWDRAVRDVGRALPAASVQVKRVQLLLAAGNNNTDVLEQEYKAQVLRQQRLSVLDSDDANKPTAEIQRVTSAVLEILTTDRRRSGRGLRTAAPAGASQARERQQRAYIQRKKLIRQQGDVTKVVGGVVDTAFELKRELAAETSTAGYRTKNVRKAIAAGTSGILQAVKETTARLASSKEPALPRAATTTLKEAAVQVHQVQQQVEDATFEYVTPVVTPIDRVAYAARAVNYTEVVANVRAEKIRIDTNLRQCIASPGDTWLRPAVFGQFKGTVPFEQDGLRKVVTALITTRNKIEKDISQRSDVGTGTKVSCNMTSALEALEELFVIRNAIEQLREQTIEATCEPIANTLYADIVYSAILTKGGGTEVTEPLITRLEQVQDEIVNPSRASSEYPPLEVEVSPFDTSKHIKSPKYASSPPQATNNRIEHIHDDAAVQHDKPTADNNVWFAKDVKTKENKVAEAIFETTQKAYIPAVVDVVPEVVYSSRSKDYNNTVDLHAYDDILDDTKDDALSMSLAAEIISDDDFDVAVGKVRAVAMLSDEELEEQPAKENAVIKLSLRALDVIFFFLEKLFIEVLPKVYVYAETATERIQESNRKGSNGWKPLKNPANPKGRY